MELKNKDKAIPLFERLEYLEDKIESIAILYDPAEITIQTYENVVSINCGDIGKPIKDSIESILQIELDSIKSKIKDL